MAPSALAFQLRRDLQLGLFAAGADLDLPGFHGLRNPAQEVDLKEPVLERRALHLDVVIEVEVALERTRRDTAVKNLLVGGRRDRLRLAAGDGQLVLLRGDGDVLRREA